MKCEDRLTLEGSLICHAEVRPGFPYRVILRGNSHEIFSAPPWTGLLEIHTMVLPPQESHQR